MLAPAPPNAEGTRLAALTMNPQEIERVIFRTVQECLTNIYRHSGSPVAAICLTRSGGEIRLRVDDRGAAIPAEKLDEVISSANIGSLQSSQECGINVMIPAARLIENSWYALVARQCPLLPLGSPKERAVSAFQRTPAISNSSMV